MRRTELRKMSKPRAAAASATPALCGATAPDAAILVGGLERHFLIEEKLWRSFRQNVLQQYSPSAEVILYLKVLNLSSSGHVGRHSQKHRPKRTLAGEQFEAWLQGAREGYCELTDEESGNCETDDRGSIRLSAEAATFRQSAQECAERCLGCAQCRFISFSARHRDCSWFHACDVRDLHTPAGASHHTLQVDASSGAQRGSEQDQLVQRLREQALRQLAPAAVRIDLDSDTVPRLSREVAQTCRQQRSLRLSDSALGYFHTLKALWQLMAGREAERGRTFEQLMFVRPDLVHWLPMGPHCLFRRSVVHHSMGATCAKEVGRVPPHSVDGVSSNRVGMCALYAGFARPRALTARGPGSRRLKRRFAAIGSTFGSSPLGRTLSCSRESSTLPSPASTARRLKRRKLRAPPAASTRTSARGKSTMRRHFPSALRLCLSVLKPATPIERPQVVLHTLHHSLSGGHERASLDVPLRCCSCIGALQVARYRARLSTVGPLVLRRPRPRRPPHVERAAKPHAACSTISSSSRRRDFCIQLAPFRRREAAEPAPRAAPQRAPRGQRRATAVWKAEVPNWSRASPPQRGRCRGA